MTRRELAPTALFSALVAVGFFAPSIFLGEVPTQRDFINTLLPHKIYAASALASGRLPLWSPEAGFGAPFFANYQSGVLYPLSAIFAALPTPLALGLYFVSCSFVAGVGTALWLGRRGISAEARLLAVVVMMVGGPMISITPWNHFAVAVWIPLALYAAERLVEAPRLSRFTALTAIVTVQGLGGSPEAFAQSAVLVAAASLYTAGRDTRRLRAVALVALSGIVAIALCALQLLPTLEYYLQTERFGGLAAEEAMDASLSWKTLLTLVDPHRVVDGVVPRPIDGPVTFYWSIYLGLVPLVLIPLGLASARGARFGIVAATALVLALGDGTPLYPFLYGALPGLFGAFRYPQKFLVTAHVALAVLAALGLDRLLRGMPSRRRALLGGGLVALALFDLVDVHAPAMFYTDWQTLYRSPSPQLLSLDGRARLFQYRLADAGITRWRPKIYWGTDWRRRNEVLWASLVSNTPLVYGIRYVGNADSFAGGLPAVQDFYRALRAGPVARSVHALRALDVGLLTGETPLESTELAVVREGRGEQTWIYRVIDPAPRVYLARRALSVKSVAEAMAAIREPTFVPGVDATVEAAAALPAGDLAGGRATIVADRPEDVSIEVDAAGPAFLVVTDALFPGWIAEVDGRPNPILRANGLVRGVVLESGRHTVRFAYRPRSFRQGLRVSLVAALAFAASLAILTIRDRRKVGRRLESRRPR